MFLNIWWAYNDRKKPTVIKDKSNVISLPVKGQICIDVHRGKKIFNLRKNTVTKIFEKDIDINKIRQEIISVTTASDLDFAPKVIHSDINNRIYEEKLIRGIPVQFKVKTNKKKYRDMCDKLIVEKLESMYYLKNPIHHKKQKRHNSPAKTKGFLHSICGIG